MKDVTRLSESDRERNSLTGYRLVGAQLGRTRVRAHVRVNKACHRLKFRQLSGERVFARVRLHLVVSSRNRSFVNGSEVVRAGGEDG